MRYGFRSISWVAFAACIINLFTGCATESRADLFAPLSDTFVTEDTASSADTAETDEDTGNQPDTAASIDTNTPDSTPGPGVEDKKHECDDATDCESPVACGEAACYPMEGGIRRCFSLAKKDFCDDGNICTFDSCNTDPQTAEQFANLGCNHKPRGCDDGNTCTIDVCDPTSEEGCVSKTNPKACNDEDACTKDVCLPGGSCNHVAETCDDGQLDTMDGCIPSTGCYHHPVACDVASDCLNTDPCMMMVCSFGQCVSEPVVCNDGVACTNDKCQGGACAFISNCADNSVCTDPVCNTGTGSCVPVPINCNDDNACTADGCMEGFGCSNEKIAGCCLNTTECVDGNPCTEEYCDEVLHVCKYVSVVTDDKNSCTVDSCDTNGLIQHVAIDALCFSKSTGEPLTPGKTRCSISAGCVECIDYTQCDDGNTCTSDICDPIFGTCSHKPLCKSPAVCVDHGTWADCDDPAGYCTSDSQCFDDNACTENRCVDNFCNFDQKVVCEEDDSLCTTAMCEPLVGCFFDYKTCNDDDVCTYDSCVEATGKCEYSTNAFCRACKTNADCKAESVCVGNTVVPYGGVCNNGQCFYNYPTVCQDNACEISTCKTGVCTFSPKDCDDGDACTSDKCSYNEGCMNIEDSSCNDYNPCTIDSCDPVEGCKNVFDQTQCITGTTQLCKGYWNCQPCTNYNNCVDSDPSTLEECRLVQMGIGICLHKVVGYEGGVGVGNFSQEDEDYTLRVQFEDGGYMNIYLEAGGTPLHRYGESFLVVHEAKDSGTGEEYYSIPAAIACINAEGILTLGTFDQDGTFTCQSDDPPSP